MTSPLMITIPIDSEALQTEMAHYLAYNATVVRVSDEQKAVTLAVTVPPLSSTTAVETARTIRKLLDMERQFANRVSQQHAQGVPGCTSDMLNPITPPMTSEQVIGEMRNHHRSAFSPPIYHTENQYTGRRYGLKR